MTAPQRHDRAHVAPARVDLMLRASAVFAVLDETSLARLAAASGHRRYDRDEIVFRQGDPGDCLYVVGRGSIEISVQDPEGAVAVLAVLEPSEVFGELAVVDGGPRVAMASAREPTDLVRIPRATVLALLLAEPSVTAGLMASLVRMVRGLDEQVSDLALRPLPHRVRRHVLAATTRKHGPDAVARGGVLRVDLRINQSDLARQVGGSRQQVNRALAALDGTGAIEREGQRIVAVRPELLAFDE